MSKRGFPSGAAGHARCEPRRFFRGPVWQAALWLLAVAAALRPAPAQSRAAQPMGTVATSDARVTGGLAVRGEQAQLLTNTSVTALDRTAPVALARGGDVLVCSTSEFHLLRSGGNGSLIFGLNRGALEIQSPSFPQDVVLTPDLKITPLTSGPLHLALRVTPEGDTCVDNAGATAPVLVAGDAFSSATYRILPGQHLLFVKGDIHRVVDHERSPCGCPTAALPQRAGAEPGRPLTPAQAAAAANPFPEAQSAGLAPDTDGIQGQPAASSGTQVTTSLNYTEGAGIAPAPPPPSPASSSPGTQAAPAAEPQHKGFGSALRQFFYRLFHPGKG